MSAFSFRFSDRRNRGYDRGYGRHRRNRYHNSRYHRWGGRG